jgi:hypothetical protein
MLARKAKWGAGPSTRDIFYLGLKENVKDLIIAMPNRPTTLIEMIRASVDYGDRILERQYERKGASYKPSFQKENTSKPKFYSRPIPIDLDYTTEGLPKRGKKGKAPKKGKKKDKKDTKYFNCNKKGH